MVRSLLLTATCVGNLIAVEPAFGASHPTPLSVHIIDMAGKPIPGASIRIVATGKRPRISHVTKDRVPLNPNPALWLEVSAPGYETESVTISLRGRNNQVQVTLMPVLQQVEEGDLNERKTELQSATPMFR